MSSLEKNKAYQEILQRLEFHIQATKRQSSVYYRLMFSLQWGIPFLSGLLTFFASGKAGEFAMQHLTFLIGFIVTILTIMNSSINPSRRFSFAVKYSLKFWNFKDLLILELQKLETEIDSKEQPKKINALLEKKMNELSNIIREFSQGPTVPKYEPTK
ncbi:MAG: hypothetical protein M1438_06580 [Deltaproteobacteria bacterium]|nr:hypothetical protein [Deltaproteobacteria bacterium]